LTIHGEQLTKQLTIEIAKLFNCFVNCSLWIVNCPGDESPVSALTPGITSPSFKSRRPLSGWPLMVVLPPSGVAL
jgi:hypothetical protein